MYGVPLEPDWFRDFGGTYSTRQDMIPPDCSSLLDASDRLGGTG